MSEKNSFVFFLSWRDALSGYPEEIRLEVYDAIIEYAASGTPPQLRPLAQMAFQFIKLEMDRNDAKYQHIREVRRNAGRRGADITNQQRRQKSANADKSGLDVDVDVDEDVDESLCMRDNAPGAQEQTQRESFLKVLLFEKCLIRPAQELERFISHYSKTGWKDRNGNQIIDKIAALRAWDYSKDAKTLEKTQIQRWQQITLHFLQYSKPLVEQSERLCFFSDFRGLLHEDERLIIYCTKSLHNLMEKTLNTTIISQLNAMGVYRILYQNRD